MEKVFGEVRVSVGKGAAHIVALAAARLDKLLELRNDPVVAAAA